MPEGVALRWREALVWNVHMRCANGCREGYQVYEAVRLGNGLRSLVVSDANGYSEETRNNDSG